jgi:hypothetical protein
MKPSSPSPTRSRRARGIALAVLAAALSLLALYALYAPLVRSHGPAASSDQFAQSAVRDLPYPFDCVM